MPSRGNSRTSAPNPPPGPPGPAGPPPPPPPPPGPPGPPPPPPPPLVVAPAGNEPTSLTKEMKKAASLVPMWSSTTGEKGRDWLRSFERNLASEGASNPQLLLAMPLRLTGDASRWHGDLTDQKDPSLNTWDTYRIAFITTWDPEPTGTAALSSLVACRIGATETIQQHLIRFRQCVSDTKQQWGASFLAWWYVERMRKGTHHYLMTAFQSHLSPLDPKDQYTYAQLSVKAEEYEKSSLHSEPQLPPTPSLPTNPVRHAPPQVRAVPPPPPPPPSNIPSNLWTLPIPPPPPVPPQLWAAPLPLPAQNTSPSLNRVSTSPKRRQDEQSGRQEGSNKPRKNGGVGPHAPNAFPDKLCFACRKQGHYANFCPDRGFDWGKHIKEEDGRKGP
jgi:hypothetical protein